MILCVRFHSPHHHPPLLDFIFHEITGSQQGPLQFPEGDVWKHSRLSQAEGRWRPDLLARHQGCYETSYSAQGGHSQQSTVHSKHQWCPRLRNPTLRNKKMGDRYRRNMCSRQEDQSFPKWNSTLDFVLKKGHCCRCTSHMACFGVLQWACFMPRRDLGLHTP